MNANKTWLIGLMAVLIGILLWYHYKDMLISAIQLVYITQYGFSRLTPRLVESSSTVGTSVPSCVNLPWYLNPYYYTVAFGTFVAFVTQVSILALVSYYRYRYSRVNKKVRRQKMYLEWMQWHKMFYSMMSSSANNSSYNTNNQRDFNANLEQHEMVLASTPRRNSSPRRVRFMETAL